MKRNIEPDIGLELARLAAEAAKVSKQAKDIWARYYVRRSGESPVMHLPCDSCREEQDGI